MSHSGRDRYYQTEAVILHRLDMGEADRLVTLITPRYGKVRAVAKGIRRPASHLGGNLELFTRSRLQLARGRDLDIITQAEVIDAYRRLREDLPPIQCAYYLVELLDALAVEDQPNEPAYFLLVDCLSALDNGHPPAVVARYYEIKLLGSMGYRLESTACVSCRRPLEPAANAISMAAGGILCPTCAAGTDAEPVSVGALKVLRLSERAPLATLLRYRLPADVLDELEALGHRWVQQHLEREPRTWAAFSLAPERVAGTPS